MPTYTCKKCGFTSSRPTIIRTSATTKMAVCQRCKCFDLECDGMITPTTIVEVSVPVDEKYTVKRLVAIGGKEWKKTGKHRVYFNLPLTAKLYGIIFCTRDLYSIESATIYDKMISVSEAIRIFNALRHGKIWFDFDDHEFHWWYGNDDIYVKIRDGIEKLLDAMKDD